MIVFMSVVAVKEGVRRPSGKCGCIIWLLRICSNGWYCHHADTQGSFGLLCGDEVSVCAYGGRFLREV